MLDIQWIGFVVLYLFTILPFLCITKDLELPKLILISMDGFRYNLLDDLSDEHIPNFRFFIQNGLKASYVRNVFPSITFPNHMTIVTGLYPESHGVVDNIFYDPFLEETFSLNNYRQNFESKWFDNGGEPIWVTNFNSGQNRDSGVIMWPGGVAEIKSYQPRVIPGAYWDNLTIAWNGRIDLLLKWFSRNSTNIRPINLGVLYFPEPDDTEHSHGPDSEEVKQIIYKLDKSLGYLKTRLLEENLLDKINIIITADHGQTSLQKKKRVDVEKYLNSSMYITRLKDNLVSLIDPAVGVKIEDLYKELKKIPDEAVEIIRKGDKRSVALHFEKNRRISEFILAAKEDYIMGDTTLKGSHGYDPDKVHDMYPFFIAYGPAFKKGTVEPLNMVDIYPLMCHILGIKPAANNGSLDNVRHFLVNPPSKGETFQFSGIIFLLVVIFVALVGGIFSIGACRQGRIMQYTQTTRKIVNYSDIGHSSLLNNDDEDDDEF